jgi:transcriptional regulator with XRE-family HTH domain
MAVVPDPSVQRRRLRTELRRARDAAGLKQADVARAMDWSPSKIIRIESGQVSISTNDLRALLDEYKVKDRGRVTSLLEMAKAARAGSVYDKFGEEVIKPGFREYLANEGSAEVIRQYDPLLISGLVQTEDYARTLLKHAGVDEELAGKIWAVREQRQKVHEREDPPEIILVIDEAALIRPVGRDWKVMRAQVRQLLEFAERDHMTIRVLPNSAGAHPGLFGNFFLLEFSEADIDDLVGLDAVDDFAIKTDSDTLVRYADRFEKLEELSLSPDETIAYFEKLLGEQPHAEVAPAPEAVAG